jgi:hypothetical protein
MVLCSKSNDRANIRTCHLTPMKRVVDPEWLDEFAPNDPRARESRQDLQRLNRILGHARRLARALAPALAGRDRPRVVDLGAGDGLFPLRLARHLPRPRETGEFLLVDRHALDQCNLSAAFSRLGWELRVYRADVFEWLESDLSDPCDAMVANLFLHHFPKVPLERLLRGIAARSSCFAACETRRNLIALAASRLVGLIGCRAVTRHDAVVSVHAGFREDELTRLWPAPNRWQLEEHRLGWCSHWFMARRKPCPGN